MYNSYNKIFRKTSVLRNWFWPQKTHFRHTPDSSMIHFWPQRKQIRGTQMMWIGARSFQIHESMPLMKWIAEQSTMPSHKSKHPTRLNSRPRGRQLWREKKSSAFCVDIGTCPSMHRQLRPTMSSAGDNAVRRQTICFTNIFQKSWMIRTSAILVESPFELDWACLCTTKHDQYHCTPNVSSLHPPTWTQTQQKRTLHVSPCRTKTSRTWPSWARQQRNQKQVSKKRQW